MRSKEKIENDCRMGSGLGEREGRREGKGYQMLCVPSGSQECQKKMLTMQLDITVTGLMSKFPRSFISGFFIASSSYYLDEDIGYLPIFSPGWST